MRSCWAPRSTSHQGLHVGAGVRVEERVQREKVGEVGGEDGLAVELGSRPGPARCGGCGGIQVSEGLAVELARRPAPATARSRSMRVGEPGEPGEALGEVGERERVELRDRAALGAHAAGRLPPRPETSRRRCTSGRSRARAPSTSSYMRFWVGPIHCPPSSIGTAVGGASRPRCGRRPGRAPRRTVTEPPGRHQPSGGRQPGQPGADHDDVGAHASTPRRLGWSAARRRVGSTPAEPARPAVGEVARRPGRPARRLDGASRRRRTRRRSAAGRPPRRPRVRSRSAANRAHPTRARSRSARRCRLLVAPPQRRRPSRAVGARPRSGRVVVERLVDANRLEERVHGAAVPVAQCSAGRARSATHDAVVWRGGDEPAGVHARGRQRAVDQRATAVPASSPWSRRMRRTASTTPPRRLGRRWVRRLAERSTDATRPLTRSACCSAKAGMVRPLRDRSRRGR